MTKNKGTTELHSKACGWRAEKRSFMGTGKDRCLVPGVLLDLPKPNSFKYKRGSVKLYSQSHRVKSTTGFTGHVRDSPDITVPTSAPLNAAAEASRQGLGTGLQQLQVQRICFTIHFLYTPSKEVHLKNQLLFTQN